MYQQKAEKITHVIANYLDGIYYGDIEKLRESFNHDAVLFGDVKGAEYLKTLNDYLEGVKSRQSPAELNEDYRMEIVGLDILGNVAVAKLHVPMLGYNYYDFLSLSVVEGEWKIVNKLFTHVE